MNENSGYAVGQPEIVWMGDGDGLPWTIEVASVHGGPLIGPAIVYPPDSDPPAIVEASA